VRALSEPSRLAAAVFLLLVGATVAAFFAAQRLKSENPLLRYRASDRAFSPNGDGIKDSARIRFKLPEGDDVTVTILDQDGGAVARVARNRYLPKGEVTLRWDGRGDDGVVAPEDTYRVRVGLRRHGRTNTLPHEVELDLTPPLPRIRAVDGPGRGPFIIDRNRRRTATAEVGRSARDARFSVWRTDGARPRRVVERLPPAGTSRRARWNGRVRGRPAPPGTYLIAAEVRDRAGNLGSIPRQLPPAASGRVQGGVGVVVRPLALTPPLLPVASGSRVRVRVDAGARRYRWVLRRVGGGRAGRGRSRARRLSLRIPDGPAGAYVLTVRTRADVARAAIPVAAPRPRPVLVVLPALTWQGRNDVDDDGDGLPDSLGRGRSARLDRPFTRGRLPRGFSAGEARVLAYLDRQRLRYELTTDLALAREGGASLAEHRAVILAGESRWLPAGLGDELRRFVRRGGRVLSIGLDSLHRTLALGARNMSEPSERAEVDFLGARVAAPAHEETSVIAQSDEINLFAGTAGSLGTWPAWEETRGVGDGRMVATAVASGGQEVFVAYRLGRGLVIRPGVQGWGRALDDDIAPPATAMRRIWTLLRR
jgi:hypothetical protein